VKLSGPFEAKTVAAVCERISSGGTPSRNHPEYFSSDSSGHLWVKSKELLDGAIRSTEERITDDGLANSSAKYYPTNTVLVAMYGVNVGQLGWLRQPATVNQAICGLVVNPVVADFRYVFYTLMHTRRGLISQAQGAAQQNLNQDNIRNYTIPVPKLPAQRKIAAILSAYDDLIENNERRIRVLEEMAQNLYREWFVKLRFPNHQKVKLVDSQAGKIPQGWSTCKLSDLAVVNSRSISGGVEPEEILYIDIASVTDGTVTGRRQLTFSDAPNRARRLVQHGDVIWSCVRPNRRSFALILNPEPNLVVSTGFAVISGTKAPFSYLYFALTTDDFVSYLTNHATGAAYPAVTAKDFETATLLVPRTEVLDEFHDVVCPMLELCHRLGLRNSVLHQTRDLLLPRLISGELDVSQLDIRLAENAT